MSKKSPAAKGIGKGTDVGVLKYHTMGIHHLKYVCISRWIDLKWGTPPDGLGQVPRPALLDPPYFDRWNAADGDLHLEDRRTAETGGTFPCGWTSKDEDVVVNVDMIFAILPPLPCLANCPVRYSMSGGKNHLLAFSTGRLNAAHVNDF